MKLSSLTPLAFALTLAPVGCALDAGAVDEDPVRTDEGAATFPPGCIVASKLPARRWDEELRVAARASAVHSRAGYAFGRVGAIDTRKNSIDMIVHGTGAFVGNTKLVSPSDYAICSGTITVAPNARVWIGEGGLTQEQLASCRKDLDQKQCATLAHYCQPGTLTKSTCVLRTGFTVTADVYSR